jgi:hypothetical protein
MTWQTIYEDTDKRVEQDDNGDQRLIWTNPDADGARLAALTDAVDTLILDSLGDL